MNLEESNLNNKPHYAAYGWVVCSLAALFYCYEYLLRIEPSVMLQPLMQHFQVTATGLGLITSMYYYAYTPLQAVVGVTTDYLGPRKILAVAIGLCVVGSFIFAYTANAIWAASGRFFIGAGSAFAFVCVLKLAAEWLPRKYFAMFAGLTTALGMLGAMIGDVVMSWFVQRTSWHEVILVSAIVGAVLIPVFLLVIKDHEQHLETFGERFQQNIKELLKLFVNPQLILAGAIGCLLYLSLSVFGEMWGIPFVNTITQKSKIIAGEVNSMVFLGWLIGSPLSGWVSDHLRNRRIPLIWGSLLAAISFGIILIWPTLPAAVLAILLFLFGLFSSVEVITFAIGRDTVPVKYTATAMGVINLVIMLGGVIIQPLVGKLLDLFWKGDLSQGIRIYGALDYRYSLLIIPCAMLLCAVLAFFLKETHYARAK